MSRGEQAFWLVFCAAVLAIAVAMSLSRSGPLSGPESDCDPVSFPQGC